MKLGTRALDQGYRLEVHERLASTNSEAMDRAGSGDSGSLWIVAHEQTAGRGRMARHWASPRGNLYASLLLKNPSPPALAAQLGFVAGVALAQAINGLLPHVVRGHLKWPNDLLIEGAKLAGILVEGTTRGSDFFCVAGFGVNIASHPPDTPYDATHLREHEAAADSAALFTALSDAVAGWLELWNGGDNFPAVRTAWLECALPAGSALTVRNGDQSSAGAFRTIDETGRLVLDTAQGLVTFAAGDVFPVVAQSAGKSKAGQDGG